MPEYKSTYNNYSFKRPPQIPTKPFADSCKYFHDELFNILFWNTVPSYNAVMKFSLLYIPW